MTRTRRAAALLLPAVILQSVLIGGGYATGREIAEYGGRFGPAGWAAVLTILVGFTVTAFLTFEVARVFRAYSYKRFIRHLIGPAWPLFDVLYVSMAILVIAVMASAAGAIVEGTLGLPAAVGTGGVIVAVGIIIFHGTRVIEVFKSAGTVALYAAYLLFGLVVLTARREQLVATLANATPAGGEALGPGADAMVPGAGAAFVAGILYVGYNLAVYPPVLFTLHRQRTRRETAIAALIAGLMMTVPFALTWLCLLSFYPAADVLDAPVPWIPMLGAVGGPWLLVVFGLVVAWTLLETSVGMVHAIVERIDADLVAAPGRDRGLERWQQAGIAVGVLLLALLLSRFGIIALVARGYAVMGFLFIALFALPLLTVGAWKVLGDGRVRGEIPASPDR